ncbi:synaptic vesicle glycoprotein 2B-like [Sabethes cyaneus]|uniref:synaptic vesicle glycoprotein 2B-like n=1 Tax=Sabethes cyaneus TaxID=53552 RepID=UPI00237E4814|nr:synaptic vesicle glycoprotein 2B-like [Sabethes cyaneus]
MESFASKASSDKPELAKETDNSTSITFDDALSMIKFGKINCILIIVAGTILTAFMLETLGISYVIPVAECDLHLSTKQKGMVSAIGFLGVIISSHLWGFLADTMGRRKVIAPTLCLTFITTTLSSFATDFWTMTMFRFLTGFFISGSSATVYAYLGEFHNNRNRSRAIMGASFIFGIGCVLLPAIAFIVINQEWEIMIPYIQIVYRPWRLFLVVCGLPGLVSGLALYWLPESPKFELYQGKQRQTISTIQWMHRMNSGKDVSRLPISSIIADEDDKQFEQRQAILSDSKGFRAIMQLVWNQTAPLFRKPYLRTLLIVCFLHFGTYFNTHGMYMFFPEILDKMVETHAAGISNVTLCSVVYKHNPNVMVEMEIPSTVLERECKQTLDVTTYELSFILEVINAFGFALIGVIINVVGKLAIMVFVFLGCGISGALIAIVDVPLVSMWLYMIITMAGFSGSVINAVIVDSFPTNLRAMAVCIALMFGRLGGLLGANMLGFMLDSHCEWTFEISGFILLVCALLAFFIPNINACKPKRSTIMDGQ